MINITVRRSIEVLFDSTNKLRYAIKKEVAKQICACVIIKENNLFDGDTLNLESMLNRLGEVKAVRYDIFITFWYLFIPIQHYFPGYQCESSHGTFAILNGPLKLSNDGAVYNLYVGIGKSDDRFFFKGIMRDVNVELPVNGVKDITIDGE